MVYPTSRSSVPDSKPSMTKCMQMESLVSGALEERDWKTLSFKSMERKGNFIFKKHNYFFSKCWTLSGLTKEKSNNRISSFLFLHLKYYFRKKCLKRCAALERRQCEDRVQPRNWIFRTMENYKTEATALQ